MTNLSSITCVCCSVLQCAAVCCRVLQRVQNYWRSSRHVSDVVNDILSSITCVCCSVLQCAAVFCSVLQCVAACSEVLAQSLQRAQNCWRSSRHASAVVNDILSSITYVCCSVLQCAAVCCSVLQCVAGCCSVFRSVGAVLYTFLLL